jgi:Asp-tRNA(Asn)/Glu-tRNA(Gln) amidotransferase A subunit family amidase
VEGLEDAVGAWLTILLAEATSIHEDDLRRRPEVYGDDTRLYLEEGTQIPATVYLKAQRVRRLMMDGFRRALERCDVLLVPATPLPAPPLGQAVVQVGGSDEALFHALARICSPLDMTGLPALSVPCGQSGGGLPIGLQIVGRPFDEATVLRAGHAYEQATEWHTRRPPL